LNSATLYTASTGLRLTKGYMGVDGRSFLFAQSSSAGSGFRFGDGVTAANNLTIEIMPAATLQLLSGIVEDANV
jgi:hypothetical protein